MEKEAWIKKIQRLSVELRNLLDNEEIDVNKVYAATDSLDALVHEVEETLISEERKNDSGNNRDY